MNRFLSNIAVIVYVLLSGFMLFWWAPHFFISNMHLEVSFNPRYIAATGFPFGLLLAMCAARQSLYGRFSVGAALQSVASGLTLWLGVYTFYFPPQANFFCRVHVWVTLFFVLLSFWQYRRVVKEIEQYEAAAA